MIRWLLIWRLLYNYVLAAKQISGGRYSGRNLFIWRPPYNYMAAAILNVELSLTIFVAFDSLFT